MSWSHWLSRSRLWGPAVVLLVLNLGLLFAYRLVVTVRVSGRAAVLEQREGELAALEEELRHLEESVALALRTREEIDSLRTEAFGTRAGRLTAVMLRVKGLAQDAGVRGQDTISYPEEDVRELGLVRKSFAFAVSGTYRELRQFINLLELDQAFLSLDEIRLSDEGASGQLRIQVRLSTLFVDPRPESTS